VLHCCALQAGARSAASTSLFSTLALVMVVMPRGESDEVCIYAVVVVLCILQGTTLPGTLATVQEHAV